MQHDKYKDAQGRYMTQSLFYEYAGKGAPFTLKPYDHEGSLSMKKLYLEAGDVTGYVFATEVLGSWEHWNKLLGAEWFNRHAEQWLDELEVKIRAEGILQMKKASHKSTPAAQWLAEKKWAKNPVGRPTKSERKKDQSQLTEAMKQAEEEARRLGLN